MVSAVLLKDFYKLSHTAQFPKGTQFIYSNTTPRSSRLKGIDEVVVFGLQYFIKEYLIKGWGEWFKLSEDDAIKQLTSITNHAIGPMDVEHYRKLHQLGYLPVTIKALPEGERCPIGVPFMTIVNTHPDFYWVTNMLETLTQCAIWQSITSATIAYEYKKALMDFAKETGDPSFVKFQGHDFSFRGMSSVETACVSGAAHLTSFVGTDTMPAIQFLVNYYNADLNGPLIGCSVPATEHAVVSCGTAYEDERETYRRLLEDVYPSGIVSLVSDTYDLWNVLTNILPSLKDVILNRDGKAVIRPDSGDPVEIICGVSIENYEDEDECREYLREELADDTPHGEYGGDITKLVRIKDKFYEATYIPDWNRHDKQFYYMDGIGKLKLKEVTPSPSDKGVVELLWEEFGGTINEKGYKVLNPKVGVIYGDSITLDRAKQICSRLKEKGFASTNIVLGVGSFTYQFNTRDTFSIACKATRSIVNGSPYELFKDPITGQSKKSAKGLLQVYRENNTYKLKESCTPLEESGGCLETIFTNGCLIKEYSLEQIRGRLKYE